MKALKRSIIFPELETRSTASSLVVSKESVRQLCDLNPVTRLIDGIGNFAVERTRTRELGKRLAAEKAAIDAEYTELERQAYIEFSEKTKRLEEEFKAKSQMLELQLQKAEAEAENAFLEHQTEFQKYLRTSEIYAKVFDSLKKALTEIEGLLKLAEENKLTNNRYYTELGEHYRRLHRGIANYAKFIS